MDNKTVLIAVGVVALLAIASAVVIMTADDTDMSSETEGIRVTIYGNANGDDVIDARDKAIIEKIVEDGITDWRDDYVYADADQDGKITSADADVVQSYIDRESTTLYYKDYFGNVAHIPYPIGDRVGVDHPYPALLMATTGLYDLVCAVDDMTGMYYDDSTFPGLYDMDIIGSSTQITLEQVAAADVDAFIIYSNWGGCCYLYEQAEKSGLADDVAFITVDIKAADGVTGTLMLGALFNTMDSVEVSLDYTERIEGIVQEIEDADFEKSTVMFDYIAKFGDDYYQYLCGGVANAVSAIVVDFPAGYEDAGNIMVDEETMVAATKGMPIIIQYQAPQGVARADMKEYVQDITHSLLRNSDAYATQEIIAIDSDVVNSVGAFYGAYITAALLYGVFEYEDAVEKLEYFLANFTPAKVQSAEGFVYSSGEIFGTA